MAEPVSALVLAAIAHPHRLALLVALERRPATSAELAERTKTTEAEVEQGLAVLHDAGLVTANAGPGRRRYRTTGHGWTSVAGALIVLGRASRAPGEADAGASS